MRKRHFLVKEIDGQYQLREIDAAIGHGISRFGITTGYCHAVEATRWIFYFMNASITRDRADDIAAQLAEDFLSSNA